MIENEAPILANSLWVATANPMLNVETCVSSQTFDVAVIGGGFSGVSTALHCVKHGLSVCLVEKETIGWGASGRNGGQVIPGLKELPETILSYFGADMGRKIVNLAGNAPDYVFKLIKENKIDCEAEQKGWIQASIGRHGLDTNKNVFRQWHDQEAPIELLSSTEIGPMIGSSFYSGGIIDFRGGKLHPLNYITGLAKIAQKKGVRIFQKTPVMALAKHKDIYSLDCPSGQVLANKVVLATNGYGDRATGTINKNVVPVQSVQVATIPLSDNVLKTILPGGQVVSDTQRLLKYFRISNDGRLMMGGRGATSEQGTANQIKEVRRLVRKMFPQVGDIVFEYAWGGNVALTLDHFPQISVLDNGVISLSGYNGRGVALATVLGKVLADFLNGTPAKELSFPITSMKPIPFLQYHKYAIPVVSWYKKVLDNFDR